MPITSVDTDPDALTLTVVADFTAPLARLWDAFADPRQLERFWGPPTYPATFTRHDMSVGGQSHYAMTGPEGDVSRGYWEYVAVDAPHSFEVRDGFAHADGSPNRDLPSMRVLFTFAATETGSRTVTTTYFNSVEDMEKLVSMGMVEGLQSAMGQMDDVLADLTSFAADLPTATQLLSDTQVRVSRVIRGPVADVWRAHHDADLVSRWLLGPDGWTMPVCEVSETVGDSYRYEWEQVDGGARFGFTGEVLEVDAPHRAVTTERMLGTDGPSTRNELTLTPVQGGTLLTLLISYPDVQLRDTVLGTGMTDGMEASFQRLEREVLAPVG
ncbi:SRPBCC family protein [Nocardioides limicola]|uniref:SRPBCC family protein n=1 Tax=Nocardioides limicola TaxID=2803368 RepID=UPI00193BC109|nr:SRPBCC family protein [Nocardioides sp. DJM-14]